MNAEKWGNHDLTKVKKSKAKRCNVHGVIIDFHLQNAAAVRRRNDQEEEAIPGLKI